LRQRHQLLQVNRRRDIDVEHRRHSVCARPAQRRCRASHPARIGQHDVGTVQQACVQRMRTHDRVAAVVEDLPFAAGIDHDRRHRRGRAGHALEPARLDPLGAQALAQHLSAGLAADAPDHAHRRTQPRGGDRRVEGHTAGARPVTRGRGLGRPRRKGVDLEHVVERGVADAGDANEGHGATVSPQQTALHPLVHRSRQEGSTEATRPLAGRALQSQRARAR
jgi:hypothetical protein